MPDADAPFGGDPACFVWVKVVEALPDDLSAFGDLGTEPQRQHQEVASGRVGWARKNRSHRSSRSQVAEMTVLSGPWTTLGPSTVHVSKREVASRELMATLVAFECSG